MTWSTKITGNAFRARGTGFDAGGQLNMPWDSTLPGMESQDPAFPALLVLGVGLTMTSTAAAGPVRRPHVRLLLGSGFFDLPSMQATGPNITRRYEFQAGTYLDGTEIIPAVGATRYNRDMLPENLVLLPTNVEALFFSSLDILIDSFAAVASVGPVTVTGILLR